MKHVLPLCAALAASACATAPEPPPPPAPAAATHSLIVANPDAARILSAIRARGLPLAPSDVSRVELLAGAPGYVWQVGPDWLHIHTYRDRAAASAGAARFVAAASSGTTMIGWVGKPHLFHCGSAVALYLGDARQGLEALTAQCGAPVWVR